jgi:hypothetical protein
MESRNVARIRAAIREQAMRGTCSVRIEQGRVIGLRVDHGQLYAKLISGSWHPVESVMIEYLGERRVW